MDLGLQIRPMQESDVAFLVEVRNECREFLHDNREFSVEQATQWFNSTKPEFYTIWKNDSRVGYFRVSTADSGALYIGCDIHKDFRGRHLAKAAYILFIDALFHGDTRHGALTSIGLEVLDTNPRAKHLYENLGFVLTGSRPMERNGATIQSLIMELNRDHWLGRRGTSAYTPMGASSSKLIDGQKCLSNSSRNLT